MPVPCLFVGVGASTGWGGAARGFFVVSRATAHRSIHVGKSHLPNGNLATAKRPPVGRWGGRGAMEVMVGMGRFALKR
jgi:hypothetical protein